MALQLNQELQNKYPHLEISVLKYSDAMKDNDSKRIDSEFFKKEYLNFKNLLINIQSEYLKNIAKFNKRYPQPTYDENSNIKVINSQYIRNEFIDYENAKTGYGKIVPREAVLVNSTGVGTLGRVNINLLNFDFSLDNHINVIVVDKRIDILPCFLMIFLQTKFGQFQIEKYHSGSSGQIEIYPKDFDNFLIPLFPLEFQQQIEQMVRESHACLEQSKDLYREAEVLLYRELGLDPENPLASIEPHSGSLNISVRPLSQSLNATGRLDSEYYQQKYDEIERVIKSQKFAKLSDLVNMQKSIEPGSEAYQENGIPFIRVSNFNKFGISDTDIFLDFAEFSQTIKPKKETILLSKDGSIGIAYCVKDDGNFITSSALLHLNIKREKQREILPEYLTLILNSILVKLQAERDSGGSIIAHWRISEIEQILIPILDISIQEKIENLIKQSFTLRQKESELLQTAKQSVETAIEKG
ncbi:MAG: restriction endonuclease subunit S [Neisseriaceae bacterium]|nr:restriction endonuclease subunit S [Neisseriaceae bacterium]